MNLLKASRLAHLYLGIFISPALLFFALSGALQTFGLHETNRDHPNYTPAKWIVVLGQIHKNHTTALPNRRPQLPVKSTAATPPTVGSTDIAASSPAAPFADHPHHAHEDSNPEGQSSPAPAAAQPAAESPRPPSPAPNQGRKSNPLPLRIFFLIVALGLFVSTLTGLYMAYKYNRNRLLVTLILIAGTVLPLLLLLA